MVAASQIARWAGTTPAQSDLPRLIRRLIHCAATTTEIAMPAGDSVNLPGFDGELHSKYGNTWVPAGHSCWELSCRADVVTKANEDFIKRGASPPDYRATRTYVALTARRWPSKARWRAEKIAESAWNDVRAYDADDLEQWLEQAASVRLAFEEELGLSGAGVESLKTYFGKWGAQCEPRITPAALLTGRADAATKLIQRVGNIRDGSVIWPLAIKADSVEEATAFAAAALLEQPNLANLSVVVTSVEGWRFVEANESIGIAVAATPFIAEVPPVRNRLVVIVPYASGDMARHFKGVAASLNDAELLLDRALSSEFEKALQLLGLDESDARRLSTLCGRSWSVFRRQHAVNPSIRRPAWRNHPAADALATICLTGSWSTAKNADTEIIARISGRAYLELEEDLLALERLDDSPLLHIGTVWKAKSALELLALFGDRITSDQLQRYFAEMETVLAAPDPQLELADDQRYAAAIYGKVRPISGLLLNSLCDTLIKLAVRGVDMPTLVANDIQGRVDYLVRALLRSGDRIRWLSLANQLPALAEASPHEFLSAVENGITQADRGASAVFLETNGSGLGDRCWHAGMLRALETLAWAPNRLRRVSLILARLCSVEIHGNWVNTPRNSLLSIYRSWLPQTAATIEQRINVIDYLIDQAPDEAFTLLDSMTDPWSDTAWPNARPQWRDDDAGAGYGATGLERHTMDVAAIDRKIAMSSASAAKISQLIPNYTNLDASRQLRIIKLLNDSVDLDDTSKEILRASLRTKLHWHLNYDKRDEKTLRAFLNPLEAAYVALAPTNRVVRHAWLFRNNWVDLPVRTHDEVLNTGERQGAVAARAALKEIFDGDGWRGVLQLAEERGDPWTIGGHLPHIGLTGNALYHWIAEQAGDLHFGAVKTILASAILSSMPPDQRGEALDTIFAVASESHRSVEWLGRLLILFPHDSIVWRRAEEIGQNDYFWSNCAGNLWLNDPEDMMHALGKLVEHGRPVSALKACHFGISAHDPMLVMTMLEGIIRGQELEQSQMPQCYAFQQAIDFIETAGSIDEMRLVQLEFALIRTLGFEGEHHAKTLYRVLMAKPELFVELLCLVYPAPNEAPTEADHAQKNAALNAWNILRACRRQPGTGVDDIIDANQAAIFVTETRQLAAEQDRLGACDSTLGEIFAKAPIGADGVWPGESARSILNDYESEDMLRGFYQGTINKRGVSSRHVYDGGDQERLLAGSFRKNARALEETHPQLAAVLHSLARSYEKHGHIADLDARLRIEDG